MPMHRQRLDDDVKSGTGLLQTKVRVRQITIRVTHNIRKVNGNLEQFAELIKFAKHTHPEEFTKQKNKTLQNKQIQSIQNSR